MTSHINSQSGDEIPKPPSNTCCVCHESIEIGAKKCVHCNSYQDWRRYLNLSSTMLALIVALVSVLSISIPMLKDNFKPNNSKINILFQSDSFKNLTFIASNSGNRPGGIGNVSMRIDGGN